MWPSEPLYLVLPCGNDLHWLLFTQPWPVSWTCPGLWITYPWLSHSLISHHHACPYPLTPQALQAMLSLTFAPSHSLVWFPALHSPTSPSKLLLVLENTACVSSPVKPSLPASQPLLQGWGPPLGSYSNPSSWSSWCLLQGILVD